MSRILIHTGLLLALALAATPAAAKRGGGIAGWGDQLVHVAETAIDGGGAGKLSLCIKANRAHFFFLNIYRTADKYVLAEDRCDSDSYLNVPAEMLAPHFANGNIPAHVPREPRFTLKDRIFGYLGTIIFAPLILIGILRRNRGQNAAAPATAADTRADISASPRPEGPAVSPAAAQSYAMQSAPQTGAYMPRQGAPAATFGRRRN